MRTDGRTDEETNTTKQIVAFSNFVDAPKHETCTRWIKCVTVPFIINSIYCNINLQYFE